MNNSNESVSMALFCDFENVALGVRDTKYQKFDIRPVLERLLLKGSIVVKKAYCDWERYKEFKSPMHEANFELIEIPHLRQSGKNSADIRLVVDALDFCYTKSHVDTFVIISGDSDFSPLVSKLRENNKKVIGVGVKQSTSDLLVANCDEFIFYDDLAREGLRKAESRRDNRGTPAAGQRRTPEEERKRKEELELRKTQAVEMVVETFEALMAERGDSGKIWASVLKDALKRRRPDFNESYYGFRAFGNLLDEAQSRGFLEVGREENSSAYVYRSGGGASTAVQDEPRAKLARRTRGGRRAEGAGKETGQQPVQHADQSRMFNDADAGHQERTATEPGAPLIEQPKYPDVLEPRAAAKPSAGEAAAVAVEQPDDRGTAASAAVKRSRSRTRRASKTADAGEAVPQGNAPQEALVLDAAAGSAPEVESASAVSEAPKKAARKTSRSTTTRTRRPRKTASTEV
ncbi:HTH OST-type domain-containing protein [Bordetella tumbae]|uniref:NYN domain-containing protein n=1 Tax=Bordetella tumbae TaxID=1649139 RepID=UPI0039EE28BF